MSETAHREAAVLSPPASGRAATPPGRDLTGAPELTAAERFALLRDRVHRTLPGALGRIVPATAIGFAAISSFTYAVDLGILAVGYGVVGLPYPLAVTLGYLVAFTLAFVLNRWLNFQSHGHVAGQTGRYVLTVAANYLLFILLLSTTLEAVGVHFLAARLVAGACEAVFMYLMMRIVVFRQKRYA
ncbi:GtrA family protein [Ornithinimicrobium sp. W1679]|uniref:GtrA family protein n=1 Tax=Ornithinimicrobium sp. W1679 TaxID=3418770 RepID=UPI003CF0D498